MEKTLKLILNKLDIMESSINELKEGQKKLDKREQEHFDHLTKETFKAFVKLEDKIDRGLQSLDVKLDRIYVNTDSIAKQFTDTTKQELPVLRSRQMEHSNQLEDHEERIVKLEAIE